MVVEEIEWIDKEGKEAIIKVANETGDLRCFSCPCSYNIGDTLSEPLECLDTDCIVECDICECLIRKEDGEFKYTLRGRLADRQNGFIDVDGFRLHIDSNKIPKDIKKGMFIQFVASRIDVW
jgi:hypothetical protein